MKYKKGNYLQRWLDSSDVVCEKPCVVHSVYVKGDGVGNVVVDLRNGHDAAGELVFSTFTIANRGPFFVPKYPMKFSRGLYVKVVADVLGVYVQYTIAD